MGEPDVLTQLLERAQALDRSASELQGSTQANASADDVSRLVADYQDWLAEARVAMPEGLRDSFQEEYEGGFFTPKIKAFLQAPFEPSPLLDGDEPTALMPYWQYPYQTTFHGPLVAQQQILREAAQAARVAAERAGPARELLLIEQMLRSFTPFLSALQSRQRGRPGFEVTDEYDVQDLLNGLLRLFFADVRPEEWTPSYAGGSSRMDFLVKRERIVVEAKMTRRGLKDRALGEELIIDKERYRAHPDCDVLVAFVYDPQRLVRNPHGLEDDLAEDSSAFIARVVVVT